MARCDRDFPHVWLPQMPSCSSSRSDSDISGCTQSRYGPENDRSYNFLSSDNQNQGAFLRILSVYIFSSGKMSLSRNFNMGSIQLGSRLTWWTWRTSFSSEVGVYKSSTIITRGKFRVEEVARVARELAWVFSPWGDMRQDERFKFCLHTPNLTQIPLHSWISGFQFPFHLADYQSWIRE